MGVVAVALRHLRQQRLDIDRSAPGVVAGRVRVCVAVRLFLPRQQRPVAIYVEHVRELGDVAFLAALPDDTAPPRRRFFGVVGLGLAQQRGAMRRRRVAGQQRHQLLHDGFCFSQAGLVVDRLLESPFRVQAETTIADLVRRQEQPLQAGENLLARLLDVFQVEVSHDRLELADSFLAARGGAFLQLAEAVVDAAAGRPFSRSMNACARAAPLSSSG